MKIVLRELVKVDDMQFALCLGRARLMLYLF